MKKLFLSVLCIVLLTGCKKETTTVESAPAAPAASADGPITIGDNKYTEIGKKAMADLSKGDMDAWLAAYADNTKYYWNNGDSLVGKPALSKYWRDRRANVLESLEFKNNIWLPVNVNTSQATERTGPWLLAWYKVTAKYKGGGTMTQWMHTDYHFDANGKIDEVDHYIDRAPIIAAMPKQ